MLLAANSSQQNLMSPVVLPASVRWNSTDPFGVVHSHAPFTVAPSANGFPGEMFGQADVVAQFSNIQLSLNNNAHDHPFDIPALRAYCQREDVSVFAKSLAEYIAGMDHPSSRFICDTSTRFLLVIFLCVAIVGFIGNFLTFLVIFRTPSLHSPTNFFLASLAVSDLLLILVGVPFDILFLWQRKSFDPPIKYFCESTSTLISWFTFNSILTIVSLTGERLVAICYPFSLRPWFHRNSVLWLILVLWLISFFPSIFIGIQFKLVIQDFCGRTHQHPNGVGSKCDFIMGGGDYTFELMLCLTFMLPVFFIVYCYVKIYNTLNEATFNSYHLNATSGNGGGGVANSQMSSQHQTLLPIGTQQPPVDVPNSPSPVDGERGFFFNNSIRISSRTHSFGQQFARDSFVRNSHRSQQAQKTVMKMLIMIAALFFICYLPYHLERLIVKYEKSGGCAERQACLWLYHGTGLLQYISAALNPIIYNVMSRRFRREFQRICYRIVRKEVKPEMRIRANTVPFQKQLLQMTPLNRLL